MSKRSRLFKNTHIRILGHYENQILHEEKRFPDVANYLSLILRKKFFPNDDDKVYILETDQDFLIAYRNGVTVVTNVQCNGPIILNTKDFKWIPIEDKINR